ncbi:MAG: HAD family hydrolase [Candidatus Aenigmarchaeota archaeon]|nr:HAD family hydrolase [Candidatus Aenigmarchaeota archaeon]
MSKRIGTKTGLLIADFFDTIVIKRTDDYEFDPGQPHPDSGIRSSDADWFVRPGIDELFAYLGENRIKFAICSDGVEDRISWILGRSGYSTDRIARILPGLWIGLYGRNNRYYIGYNTFVKNLGAIMEDAGFSSNDTLLVGDDNNGLDSTSASLYNVKWYRVPNGRENQSYSLAELREVLNFQV